jgi:glycosyltransferase involved in cell wall biosynthesis
MCISIIIPTYNGVRFLGATLESVRAQTFQQWELVIVDDASTDATLELAQHYVEQDARIRLVRAKNGNVAASRNTGFDAASANAEYILFLDHDDLLEPDALASLRSALQLNPNAVAAHGLARFIDAQGQMFRAGEAESWTREREAIAGSRLIPCTTDMPTTFASLVFSNCLFTPGQTLIRRSALEAIGPLDPETAPCDDYDLWLRLCASGEMAYCDRVVLGFRKHDNNQSRKIALMKQKDRLVRRKLFAMPGLTVEQRRLTHAGWRLWHRHMATLAYWEARKSLARYQPVATVRHLVDILENLAISAAR